MNFFVVFSQPRAFVPALESIILNARWTPERMSKARSFFECGPFLMREQYQERSFRLRNRSFLTARWTPERMIKARSFSENGPFLRLEECPMLDSGAAAASHV